MRLPILSRFTALQQIPSMHSIKQLRCCPAAGKYQWTSCAQLVNCDLFLLNFAWNPDLYWGNELKRADNCYYIFNKPCRHWPSFASNQRRWSDQQANEGNSA